MKILCLGSPNNISRFLEDKHEVTVLEDKIDLQRTQDAGIEFIISYGYRYMIEPDVVDVYRNKIINLHISYLPWNRGASPNLWSVLDSTQKGVTIHYIEEGLDVGDIILQEKMWFCLGDTLKNSYRLLKGEIEWLFKTNCNKILNGKINPTKQIGAGSMHTVKQTKKMLKKLNLTDWNITIEEVMRKVEENAD